MEFNLFDLHDSERDNTVRKCLRVYGVLAKYSSKKNVKDSFNQAIYFNKWLNQINSKLKKEVSPIWKEKWLELIPLEIKKSTLKDWFCGRASPPLIAIEKLKLFGCEKEVDSIIKKINFISSTTGDIIKVPKNLTPDVAYLVGVVLGDGCLPNVFCKKENNFEYRLIVIGGSKQFLGLIAKLISNLFEKKNIRFLLPPPSMEFRF
jgi:hypothetical protein